MALAPRSRDSDLDSPELAALTNYIRDRKCVLFVGAGLSRAAGLPDWGALMRAIVERTKAEVGAEETAAELQTLLDRGRYIELADQCRELLSPAQFYELLRELLGAPVEPTEMHEAIVATPYSCVVTTNFDTLLERSYARFGGRGTPRAPNGMELANHGTLLLDGAFFILKAHGSLQHDDSMVFTADDYRRITYANPAFQSFLSALLLSRAVLFVGYSLTDPNFRLLLDSQLTTFDGEVPSRYAIMAGVGPVERELMWRTARIRVLSYPEGQHEFVGQVLRSLARRSSRDALGRHRGRTRRVTLEPTRPDPVYQFAIHGRGGQFDFGFRNAPSPDPLSSRGDRDDEWWATEPTVPDWGRLVEQLPTAYQGERATPAAIRQVGEMLAAVVPPRARAWLEGLPRNAILSLDLTTDAEILPWEWLRIGRLALCERLAVARLPVGISSAGRGRPAVAKPLRALVIGDPNAESSPPMPLAGAREEAHQVSRVLRRASRTNDVLLLVGRQATYQRVMYELRQHWFDVVHFAGHAWFDASESFVALHDGTIRVSELVSAFVAHPPSLVMLNSHFTSFIPVFAKVDLRLPASPTIGDALQFLAVRRRGFTQLAARSGVGAFVGCFGNPGDALASRLAVAFYESLMRGLSVAHAMRAARTSVAGQRLDQTYLYYTVSGYGDLVLAARRRTARRRHPTGPAT